MKEDNSLWWNGPTWLKEQDSWPPDIITVASPESNAEAKASKQIFALAVESNDVMDELLLRSSLWRTLRVGAWVARFLRYSKSPRNQRIKGQLTTEEINKQRLFWEKKERGVIGPISSPNDDLNTAFDDVVSLEKSLKKQKITNQN